MRSTQSTLAVDVQPDGATVHVRLEGELDMTSSPLLQAVVDQTLAARRVPRCHRLVVDMSGVSFADASGISRCCWPAPGWPGAGGGSSSGTAGARSSG